VLAAVCQGVGAQGLPVGGAGWRRMFDAHAPSSCNAALAGARVTHHLHHASLPPCPLPHLHHSRLPHSLPASLPQPVPNVTPPPSLTPRLPHSHHASLPPCPHHPCPQAAAQRGTGKGHAAPPGTGRTAAAGGGGGWGLGVLLVVMVVACQWGGEAVRQ